MCTYQQFSEEDKITNRSHAIGGQDLSTPEVNRGFFRRLQANGGGEGRKECITTHSIPIPVAYRSA